MADKPKPQSLRERLKNRRNRLDAAIDGPPPKPKPKKKLDPADGNNELINRKSQENLK